MPRRCSRIWRCRDDAASELRVAGYRAEAREWVQTKIDLFDRDDQLSLWTVIHTESGQIVGDVGLQHEDTVPVRWLASADAATDSSGVKDSY